MAVACASAISLHAHELRVTTWSLNNVPDSPGTPLPAEAEESLINRAAETLSATGSDVIVLREVRDRQMCQRIAERLTGGAFGVVACSDFNRISGSTGTPAQVAILSKTPAFSAWTESWKSENTPSPEGGFAFAEIREGDSDVCIYALQLPALTRNEQPGSEIEPQPANYDSLVQQLIQHAAAAGNRGNSRATAFVVAGDLAATSPEDLSVRRGVLRALEESGLQGVVGSHPLSGSSDPSSVPGSEFFFVRNATAVGQSRMGSTISADPAPSTYVLRLAPLVPLARDTAGRQESFGRTTRLLLWSGLAAGTVLIVVGVMYGWRVIAMFRAPAATPTPTSNANFSTALTRTTYVNRLATETSPPGEVSQAPTETASSDVPIWRQRVLKAEQRADEAQRLAKDRLMPHLARMMKDKLLWRLLAQRSQNIQVHDASARVVAELEQRLALIQSHFESRVQSYENRIAELERELAAKESITRELLESRIQVARLAVEQEAPPVPKPSVVYTLRFGDLMARKSTVRTQTRQESGLN